MQTKKIHSKGRRSERPLIEQLLPGALYSWNDIQPFVQVGRETWRKRVEAGTAPQKVSVGVRGVAYRGADVLAWLSDPLSYRAGQADA